MGIRLNEYQKQAVEKMKNGCLLVGEGGSGKSRTALTYYVVSCGAMLTYCESDGEVDYIDGMDKPRDLYIITTAKKRDDKEWEKELEPFYLTEHYLKDCIKEDRTPTRVVIDSWNNIAKYTNVYGAFFIFDEQRVVGWGKWSKSFVKISRKNRWILLTATPGDKWLDYVPVFIANGFFNNITEFRRKHCIFASFTNFPKVIGYLDEPTLMEYKAKITVPLPVDKPAVQKHLYFKQPYDKALYKRVWKDRWDPWDDEPIEETGKLFYLLRKVANNDDSRYELIHDIAKRHKRIIIFYNFTYELHRLRGLAGEIGVEVGEWNGELHTAVPESEKWFYLVQYSAGAEGWNCLTCNCIIFFSQSYSYKQMKEAEWRIDRVNTPFDEVYYYHILRYAPIDLAISRALKQKRDFNENNFLKMRHV